MGLFWINIGKAWGVIKNEGIGRGGKRVFSYFFRLFQRVRSGDVLIVTCGVGDSARYRAHHVAEELNIHGIKTSVTHQDNPFLARYANRFSIFIFHRTLFTPRVERFFMRAKSLGKEIIFETDDLVYDPQYIRKTAYFEKMNVLERKLYEKGVGIEILSDPTVKVCTTSTAYLGDKLTELGKQVYIVPNKLSKQDMEWIGKIRKTWNMEHGTGEGNGTRNMGQGTNGEIQNTKYAIQDTVYVGYFSGTASHDEDFATITGPLLAILEARPIVMLVIAGPLVLDDAFEPFHDRIIRLSFAGRFEHFENISAIDINLAPLVMNDPFCESKSELKFFEAGAFGIPTVAAATGVFREAILDGEDGFVASTPGEWKEKILRLIDDERLRKQMGECAATKVSDKYTTENAKNEEYYQYLKLTIDRLTS